MARFTSDTHWRDSARQPRFFMIDARAAFPLLLFLMHIRVWTFIVAMLIVFFFSMIERFGFSLIVFFRWLRCIIAGPYKYSSPWWKE